MSFEPVTLYQLVCDRCGHAREAVEEDERDKDRADAIYHDGWIGVADGIYCPACWWGCDCGKTALGSPPVTGMCGECERNQRGRLIDVTEGYERCPGSGRGRLLLPSETSGTSCPDCPARVPVIVTATKSLMATHLRRRMFNPSAFEVGTRIRDVWTNEVFEVVEHDPRTGTTELRNTGTGTAQTMSSHNNTLYVAVREAE